MKKIAIILACLAAVPVMADDYWDEYDYATTAPRRDTYAGFRVHKNEKIAFKYDETHGGNSTIRKDNWGFGAVVGNRLTDYVKIEFETLYTGVEQSKRTRDFDYDIWANMFNVYLFREFGGAVAPYVGLGLGFAAIWGDVDTNAGNMSDSVFDLSFQAMAGVNFALNDRIDLNLGLKYQYYGEVEHKLHGDTYATTDIDATELYFGAVYKFGIK
ncbi:MAG: porin family protein [Alphaproteobacteria bacterium]|nr:porin family protein [Alphaproteobacteria bacterium]